VRSRGANYEEKSGRREVWKTERDEVWKTERRKDGKTGSLKDGKTGSISPINQQLLSFGLSDYWLPTYDSFPYICNRMTLEKLNDIRERILVLRRFL
jgi:hypothetical protein